MTPFRLPLADASYPALVAAWRSAIEPFADLAESLTPAQWEAASILPGWTNGDIVAHVVGIEKDLLGEPTPTVSPDWDLLPHADDLFSRYTELAVEARRDAAQGEVCSELRKAIALRNAALAGEPQALGEVVRGPGGWELPRGVVIRMRCFDIWCHDQDIRASIGSPGDLDTDAAWVAAHQMLKGLGRVWARAVGAPAGAGGRITVTGPGVEFDVVVVTDEQGRGQLGEPGGAPVDARLTMSWPTFTALSTGRRAAVPGEVALVGDPDLCARLLANLNVAP